jgi:hypothetical protein
MTKDEIKIILDEVYAEIGSGHGWGAWTAEEYAMAVHVIEMIRARILKAA